MAPLLQLQSDREAESFSCFFCTLLCTVRVSRSHAPDAEGTFPLTDGVAQGAERLVPLPLALYVPSRY